MRGLRATDDDVSKVLLYVLRSREGFTLEDIANDPTRLGKSLTAIFGEWRARVVIERILEDSSNHPSPPEYYSRFITDLRAYKENHTSENPERDYDGDKEKRFELRDAPGTRHEGVVHASFKAFPPDFTQKMVDAVTRGLSPMGDSGREASLYFLEKRYNVRVTDVLANPKRFLSVLTKMFGQGAQLLESSIIDDITATFALPARPASLSVAVREAGRKYTAARKRST
jgi:hypothetical protein